MSYLSPLTLNLCDKYLCYMTRFTKWFTNSKCFIYHNICYLFHNVVVRDAIMNLVLDNVNVFSDILQWARWYLL